MLRYECDHGNVNMKCVGSPIEIIADIMTMIKVIYYKLCEQNKTDTKLFLRYISDECKDISMQPKIKEPISDAEKIEIKKLIKEIRELIKGFDL